MDWVKQLRQKIESYALMDPKGDEAWKEAKKVFETNIARYVTPTEVHLKNILYGFMTLNVKDKVTFVKAFDLPEEYKELPDFLFRDFVLDISKVDETTFIKRQNWTEYIDIVTMESVYENLDYFEERYPEWKFKRLFNEEEADELLLNEIDKLYLSIQEHPNLEKKCKQLYDEVYEIMDKEVERGKAKNFKKIKHS